MFKKGASPCIEPVQVADVADGMNAKDEAEYEVSAMPYTLVKSLYVKFVGPLQRANKRPKRAAAAAGELRMDISDSD